MFGKESIRVQTTINHISIFTFLCFYVFYDNINVKENVFFFQNASEALRDTLIGWDLQSWTKVVEILPDKDLFRYTREFFNL